ncbi:hypothetical protein WDU94_005501 [Cyamophila willieti]
MTASCSDTPIPASPSPLPPTPSQLSSISSSLSAIYHSNNNNRIARSAAHLVYNTIDKYFGLICVGGSTEEGDCDGGAMLPFEGENKEEFCIVVNIRNPNTHAESHFVLPPRCKFINCDIRRHLGSPGLNPLPGGLEFDFVLLDPPWSNKFIRRRRKRQKMTTTSATNNWYHTMDSTSSLLCNIPMTVLLTTEGLVGVWCTNNKSHIDQLVDEIFPAWGVTYVATWYWIKVTKYNHPVLGFNSVPNSKQPYERLVFAVRNTATLRADVRDGNSSCLTADRDESHSSEINAAISGATTNGSVSDRNSTSLAPDVVESNYSERNPAIPGATTNGTVNDRNSTSLAPDVVESNYSERNPAIPGATTNGTVNDRNSTSLAPDGDESNSSERNPAIPGAIKNGTHCTDRNSTCLIADVNSNAARNPTCPARDVNGTESTSRISSSLAAGGDESKLSDRNRSSLEADEVNVSRWHKLPEEGKLIVSVPSGVHSHKPCLADILSLYVSSPLCLELFSRSLTPGWISMGNQVLGFQFEQFYR